MNCWDCESINRQRLATEPAPDASQFTKDTTAGLCDECRAEAIGQPLAYDDLFASSEDWPENRY